MPKTAWQKANPHQSPAVDGAEQGSAQEELPQTICEEPQRAGSQRCLGTQDRYQSLSGSIAHGAGQGLGHSAQRWACRSHGKTV